MEPTTLFVNGFELDLWDPHTGTLTFRLDTRTLAKPTSQAKIGRVFMGILYRYPEWKMIEIIPRNRPE